MSLKSWWVQYLTCSLCCLSSSSRLLSCSSCWSSRPLSQGSTPPLWAETSCCCWRSVYSRSTSLCLCSARRPPASTRSHSAVRLSSRRTSLTDSSCEATEPFINTTELLVKVSRNKRWGSFYTTYGTKCDPDYTPPPFSNSFMKMWNTFRLILLHLSTTRHFKTNTSWYEEKHKQDYKK